MDEVDVVRLSRLPDTPLLAAEQYDGIYLGHRVADVSAVSLDGFPVVFQCGSDSDASARVAPPVELTRRKHLELHIVMRLRDRTNVVSSGDRRDLAINVCDRSSARRRIVTWLATLAGRVAAMAAAHVSPRTS